MGIQGRMIEVIRELISERMIKMIVEGSISRANRETREFHREGT